MWKNIVEPYSPQMTIWRMRIACWLPTAANTHSEYIILIAFFTAAIVARTRLSVTLYVHCLSCQISQQRYPIAVCLFFTFITYRHAFLAAECLVYKNNELLFWFDYLLSCERFFNKITAHRTPGFWGPLFNLLFYYSYCPIGHIIVNAQPFIA